jgi:plasmid stabilization system protein ParE
VTYRLITTQDAQRDIREFARWLKEEAGPRVAARHLAVLDHDLRAVVCESPHAFPWFHESGPPYRAKLFRLARSTYWIVYSVDDARHRVELIRFWHTAREPRSHGL